MQSQYGGSGSLEGPVASLAVGVVATTSASGPEPLLRRGSEIEADAPAEPSVPPDVKQSNLWSLLESLRARRMTQGQEPASSAAVLPLAEEVVRPLSQAGSEKSADGLRERVVEW